MRAMILLAGCVALLGCQNTGGDDGGGFNYYNPGEPAQQPGCHADTDCTRAGDVCARDAACVPASDVHAVRVTWTINGQPASATTCAAAGDFSVGFDQSGVSGFGFAPVPCSAGVFPIDKLEKEYTETVVGPEAGSGFYGAIDPTTGAATVDVIL